MGLVDWFRSTTFEGTIKRDLGSVTLHKGPIKTRVQLQELEPKDSVRRFRLNLVSTSVLSWQSVPLVLTEPQMQQLAELVQAALVEAPPSEAVPPRRW